MSDRMRNRRLVGGESCQASMTRVTRAASNTLTPSGTSKIEIRQGKSSARVLLPVATWIRVSSTAKPVRITKMGKSRFRRKTTSEAKDKRALNRDGPVQPIAYQSVRRNTEIHQKMLGFGM